MNKYFVSYIDNRFSRDNSDNWIIISLSDEELSEDDVNVRNIISNKIYTCDWKNRPTIKIITKL
jgi:hypothetical protein